METSDTAQAEIDAAFLRLSAYDPNFAGRWLEGLTQAIESLETLPRRHERITLKNDGRETRRMLYRNGRTAYRIIFLLLDNDDDGEEETVRVLQVRSAAQFRG